MGLEDHLCVYLHDFYTLMLSMSEVIKTWCVSGNYHHNIHLKILDMKHADRKYQILLRIHIQT